MEIFSGFIKPLLYLMAVHLFVVMAENHPFFRRSPKSRNHTSRQEMEVWDMMLQANRQITLSLRKGETRLFLFLDGEKENHFFSLTLVPCSSIIKWSLSYRPKNDSVHEKLNFTNITSNNAQTAVFIYEGIDAKTVTMNDTNDGLYTLVLTSVEKDSKVTIYITMDPGGPYELTLAQDSKLTVTPRRRNRLNVKWEPRNVNSLSTKYCLVISTKKNYQTLCGAEDDLQNFIPNGSSVSELGFRQRKNGKNVSRFQQVNNDTVIACVNNKTSLTLTKMKSGMLYYLNLFAINTHTNMTIPYGSTSIKYSYTVRPITLKDGHPRVVYLKRHEGRVFFKYKAFKQKPLKFYVLVCGGSVRVEVEQKRRKKKYSVLVDGYEKFNFSRPFRGEEFQFKIDSLDLDDELNRVKYVEVFATQSQRYPFPEFPSESNVYEYENKKECDSVTIGWIPSYDESTRKYCVWVRENLRFDYEDKFREYFQCNWDKLLKTNRYVNATRKNGLKSVRCQEIKSDNKGLVTTHKVDNLEPGRSYTIQITVTKKRGRTLSYKLLKVFTKHVCDDR